MALKSAIISSVIRGHGITRRAGLEKHILLLGRMGSWLLEAMLELVILI